MKTISVAILVALLCVAVASKESPSPVADSRIQCIIDTVKSNVKDAEFKELVEKFFNKIKVIGKEEVKCIKDARLNITKIIICRVRAYKTFFDAIFAFGLDIAETNADLSEKLIKELTKCLVKPDPKPKPEPKPKPDSKSFQ